MRLATGVLSLLLALPALPAAAEPPARDRAFWTGLAAKDFAVPAGESVGALALEVADLFSSPDPALRDGVGYEALARWVYRDGLVPPADLERLRLRLHSGLKKGLGETAGDSELEHKSSGSSGAVWGVRGVASSTPREDSAYGRSFSAIGLALLAAADLKKPWMTQEAFDDLLGASADYLTAEKDLRGFVPGSGWVHATAHTADVLKFLARNPRLTPAGQARIVEAISTRLRTAGVVFTWGEDERLAQALVSLTLRRDFDPKPLEGWLAAISAENAALWKNGPAIDPRAFVPVRAQKQALVHLSAFLAREAAAPEAFRKTLNEALGKLAG
jgi:hypothetical protein